MEKEIPITYGGMIECNIENSLAAASALYGLNLSIEAIRKGLATFNPDMESNPGRFNIVDMGDFKVMLWTKDLNIKEDSDLRDDAVISRTEPLRKHFLTHSPEILWLCFIEY